MESNIDLQKFAGKRLLIVGDVVADQFLTGTISRVSREAPVFILRHDETDTRPGGAANAAANVASLGGEAILVGVIGADRNGELLRHSISSAGVSCDHLREIEGLVTTTKVRVLAGQQFANRQQVIRIDYEPRAAIGRSIEAQLIEMIEAESATSDGIVLSDYGYGIATEAVFAAVKAAAQKHGVPLVVDSRFELSRFQGATSATPNEEEAEQFLGEKFTPAGAQRIRTELGVESLLVTRGNKGMVLADARGNTQIEAVGSKEPVDVTGAGDTVIAAYSLGLASGMSHLEAAHISNHAGSIVVMKKGTATASSSELAASLERERAVAANRAVS